MGKLGEQVSDPWGQHNPEPQVQSQQGSYCYDLQRCGVADKISHSSQSETLQIPFMMAPMLVPVVAVQNSSHRQTHATKHVKKVLPLSANTSPSWGGASLNSP